MLITLMLFKQAAQVIVELLAQRTFAREIRSAVRAGQYALQIKLLHVGECCTIDDFEIFA